ncbi:DUF547 domain-containing protein [bacterium]|nr:DUF547 domain-containing protein [bacterium]
MTRTSAAVIMGSIFVAASLAAAAPKADLWPRWERHDPRSTVTVDHAAWDEFLGKYLVADDPSGINLARYGSVTPEDRQALRSYLESLEAVRVSEMNRDEQRAYWINLYNALTVLLILEHYPVKSIRDIKISPGFFSSGPWGKKLLVIEGEKVSLNDIEHRILRPIWKDNRLHYAVNCASLGCPNLQPAAYGSANTERLLEEGAREYVNHPRGVRFDGKKLVLSRIYGWFKEDFGGSEKGILEHLLTYADDQLTERLRDYRGRIKNEYDWSLNIAE